MSLQKLNPRLIYCSVTGFGQTGPYAHRAGYDFVVQGMGGFMSITGAAEGEPQKAGVAIADLFYRRVWALPAFWPPCTRATAPAAARIST